MRFSCVSSELAHFLIFKGVSVMKFDKKYVYYFKGNYYIWFGEHNGETYFDISVQPVQECELMRISSAIGVLSEPA